MSGPKVDIEYCGGWGYAPRYRELAHMIKVSVPNLNSLFKNGQSFNFGKSGN